MLGEGQAMRHGRQSQQDPTQAARETTSRQGRRYCCHRPRMAQRQWKERVLDEPSVSSPRQTPIAPLGQRPTLLCSFSHDKTTSQKDKRAAIQPCHAPDRPKSHSPDHRGVADELHHGVLVQAVRLLAHLIHLHGRTYKRG